MILRPHFSKLRGFQFSSFIHFTSFSKTYRRLHICFSFRKTSINTSWLCPAYILSPCYCVCLLIFSSAPSVWALTSLILKLVFYDWMSLLYCSCHFFSVIYPLLHLLDVLASIKITLGYRSHILNLTSYAQNLIFCCIFPYSFIHCTWAYLIIVTINYDVHYHMMPVYIWWFYSAFCFQETWRSLTSQNVYILIHYLNLLLFSQSPSH